LANLTRPRRNRNSAKDDQQTSKNITAQDVKEKETNEKTVTKS
jgi:hypothetical protein